ncbi:hypothetical protein NDU88_002535 [Pleurodeles waltl]|uniref:Uncharacterized protein n=1 Tax=Pleurodeles waltl TaxID=8319 RepID=A0AAV7VCT2_PLEWA|nr:hypothetical protein NDU88_002535 [Pleurodeles waltl]
MASAVLNDHEYSSDLPPSEVLPTPSTGHKDLSQSSDSQSDSDVSEPKPSGKRKRKSKRYTCEESEDDRSCAKAVKAEDKDKIEENIDRDKGLVAKINVKKTPVIINKVEWNKTLP